MRNALYSILHAHRVASQSYLQEFAASSGLKDAALAAQQNAESLRIKVNPDVAETDGEQEEVTLRNAAVSTETKVSGLELSVSQNTTNIQKLANVDAEILDKNDDIDGGTYAT